MWRRLVMSTNIRLKEGKSLLSASPVNRANMTNGNTKAQIRAGQSKSSPVYKTQSETSLLKGFRNLSIQDRKQPNIPKTRRGFCTGSSGKLNIRSLQDVAKLLEEGITQNVVVVAGAGISTPSGIPDFRTPGTGLYDNLQQYQIPYPEAIFDIDYFHRNPKPFFTLAKELFPSLGNYRPNYIHYFVRLLHEKGLLLRMYTQNIDGLERLAGIPSSKLVEAHGTFATATCVICGTKCDGEEIKDRIQESKLPKCKKTSCPGMVKPDIVFFGEDLPRKFYYHFKDMLQADLVIIMGTSLEVQPFAGIIDSVRWHVPRILFNREVVGPFRHHRRSKDVVAEGDILETMQKFVTMIGWRDEMKDLIVGTEGSFNVGQSVPTTTIKKEEIKTEIKDPFVNSIWQQNAKYNLNDYYSSSDSSSSENNDESDSTSSDDSSSQNEKPKKPVQKVNRFVQNPKFTKPPSGKGQIKNYSTRTNKVNNNDFLTLRRNSGKMLNKSSQLKTSSKSPVGLKVPSSPSPSTQKDRVTRNIISSHFKPSSKISLNHPGMMEKSSSISASHTNRYDNHKTKTEINNGRSCVTSVQVYKALHHRRTGSADLPRLRMRAKLSQKQVDSTSSESSISTS